MFFNCVRSTSLVTLVASLGLACGDESSNLPDPVPVDAVTAALEGASPVQNTWEYWRYVVAIERNGHYRCTGALFDARFVITAARCKPVPGDRVSFFFASSLSGIFRTVTEVYYPDDINPFDGDLMQGPWNDKKRADFAVVKMNADNPLHSQPVSLGTAEAGANVAIVSGAPQGSVQDPPVLQRRWIPVNQVTESSYRITDVMNKDLDVGSPMIAWSGFDFRLVGVYSEDSGSSSATSYFTRLKYHEGFIADVLSGQEDNWLPLRGAYRSFVDYADINTQDGGPGYRLDSRNVGDSVLFPLRSRTIFWSPAFIGPLKFFVCPRGSNRARVRVSSVVSLKFDCFREN